jgi:ubiquinone/menaquinone biosynthesis C-methylase UbiE
MNEAYFQTEAYVEYLRQHCLPGQNADQDRVLGTDFVQRILGELELRRGAAVLEVGCGLGRVMKLLEDTWGVVAHGCDVSAPAIAEAKRLLPASAGRLFVSAAERILSKGPFDHLIYWGLFEMTEQRLALVETSRLLRIGGSAMFCAVKNVRWLVDDEDASAARRAYVEKKVPITYTDLERFEALLEYLGLAVSKRLVFNRKGDIAGHKFDRTTGKTPPPALCSDVYYIVEKRQRTPLDERVQFDPNDVPQSGSVTP